MGAAPPWVTQGWAMIWGMLGRCAGSLASSANSSSASAGDTAAPRGKRSGASRISSYSRIIASARNGSTPSRAHNGLWNGRLPLKLMLHTPGGPKWTNWKEAVQRGSKLLSSFLKSLEACHCFGR